MKDALTTWGQLFTGRKSPSGDAEVSPGVGAASRFTPSFLRTEKTPAMEMVGSNPADSREKDNTAPVLFEHQQYGMCTEHGLGCCPTDCKAVVVTEYFLSKDDLDKFMEGLSK